MKEKQVKGEKWQFKEQVFVIEFFIFLGSDFYYFNFKVWMLIFFFQNLRMCDVVWFGIYDFVINKIGFFMVFCFFVCCQKFLVYDQLCIGVCMLDICV